MAETVNHHSDIKTVRHDNCLQISLIGDWLLDGDQPSLDGILAQIETDKQLKTLYFITDKLGRWDSLLIVELINLLQCASQAGVVVDKTSLPPAIQRLLVLVYAVPERLDAHRAKPHISWLNALSDNMVKAGKEAKQILVFMGETAISIRSVFRGASHFRQVDLWLYINECGPSALPIVTLISLLVGLILAFVGALELSLFGAQIYIANLVSLGMTREMGGLMTAVIMSGRTGAAFAAQLGTMHVNNEIDALKTMNLEPIAFLVLPRMIALILVMPLLCLYADLMGIIGGGLVAINLFDVSLTEYINRTSQAVQLKDFLVGFVKCSVFGVLIALSGCMRGMACGRSASAVGDAATSAVVTCIVFIVVADSLMTLICNLLGI